jgi:uncharacterized protein
MPGSSLFALLDDITILLDDVAVMTKVATKKTAGVLGDDLALNAEQLTGIPAEREVPVVLKVARGSAINKLILVPGALLISALAHWAVAPLLMVGGAFLCFEGVEKITHKFLHPKRELDEAQAKVIAAARDPSLNMVDFEAKKIKGAIRTDFVLSAEIVVISLGTVAEKSLAVQASVLATISVLMTVGVYGFVLAIVKLDDLGLYLTRRDSRIAAAVGRGFLAFAPWLMRGLSFAGTLAMFLVGGGILSHGIPGMDARSAAIADSLRALPFSQSLLPSVINACVGFAAGAILVALFFAGKRLLRKH